MGLLPWLRAQSPPVPILGAHLCTAQPACVLESRPWLHFSARTGGPGSHTEHWGLEVTSCNSHPPVNPELPLPSSGRTKGWVSGGRQEKGDVSAAPNVPLEGGAG